MATDKRTNQQYAVKIFEKFRMKSNKNKKSLLREIAITLGLNHNKIIKLVNVIEDSRNVILLMPH